MKSHFLFPFLEPETELIFNILKFYTIVVRYTIMELKIHDSKTVIVQ